MSSHNKPSMTETPVDLANGQPKAEAPSIFLPLSTQPTDHKPEDQRPLSPPNEHVPASDTLREDPAVALRKLLKGKQDEWSAAVSRKQGKLTLLELPLDVLRIIVAEASLAATEPPRHSLVLIFA